MKTLSTPHETAADLATCVREYQRLFDMHAVAFGSPEALGPLVEKLQCDRNLAMDFWELTRSISQRHDEQIAFPHPLAVISMSAGGAEVEPAHPDVHVSLQQLSTLLATQTDQRSTPIPPKADQGPSALRATGQLGENGEGTGPKRDLTFGIEAEASSPRGTPRYLHEALSRLERSNLELKVDLEEIDSRMSRLEPDISGEHAPPVTNGPRPAEPLQNVETTSGDASPLSSLPGLGSSTDTLFRPLARRRQDLSIATSSGQMKRRKSDLPRRIPFVPAGDKAFTAPLSNIGSEYGRDHQATPVSTDPEAPPHPARLLGPRIAMPLILLLLAGGAIAFLVHSMPFPGPQPLPKSLNTHLPTPHSIPVSPASVPSSSPPQNALATNAVAVTTPSETAAAVTTPSETGTQTIVETHSKRGSPAGTTQPLHSAFHPLVARPTAPNVAARQSQLSYVAGTSIFGNARSINVSSGIMAANLITASAPSYPKLASLSAIQGAVVLQAIVSRRGTIDHVHVIKGPHLLRGAAQDAVRRWRYRPYLVEGRPVDVATIITIDFTMGR